MQMSTQSTLIGILETKELNGQKRWDLSMIESSSIRTCLMIRLGCLFTMRRLECGICQASSTWMKTMKGLITTML